jgi:CheY-like chemotaxis protein
VEEMVFIKEWQILLVDDEPDVLTVSKLAMKNFEVYGLPLRIHTAASKAEAIEVLKGLTRLRHTIVAVAFIDVVMETDTAGLELCDYIRGTYDNKVMQLYIRTGQPGVAPERKVIDKYDINGYFTKTEMTEDKLYTLVKSGCRQALYMGASVLLSGVVNTLIDAYTREEMQQILSFFGQSLQQNASGEKLDQVDMQVGMIIDGTLVSAKSVPAALELDNLPGKAMENGDKLITDKERHFLVKVAATATNSEVYFFGKTTQELPEIILPIFHRFVKSLASLWKQREGTKVG